MPYDTVVPVSTRDDETSLVDHTTVADDCPGVTDTPEITGGVTSTAHAVAAKSVIDTPIATAPKRPPRTSRPSA